MNPMQQSTLTRTNPSVVLEILGIAGTGKSTVYRALKKANPDIFADDLPDVWDIHLAPFFVFNILSMIPVLIHMHGKGDRNLNRRELAWMAMLNGWPNLLERQRISGCKAIVIDQGPIFLIATLLEFGPQSLRYSKMQGWWDKIFDNWKRALDLVIWLDARDDVLARRIRTRDEDHPVKRKSDQEIRNFMAQYRQIYSQVMDRFSANNSHTRILHVDSSDLGVDEIVNMVMQAIDAWGGGVDDTPNRIELN